MGKQLWKPGNMLYPLPVVMVSLADRYAPPAYPDSYFWICGFFSD
jgi:hypothetical protein